MADEKDFLQRADHLNDLLGLRHDEYNADTAAEAFQQYGMERRAQILIDFDAELSRGNGSNLRRYATLVNTRRKMGDVHHALRKAGR